MGNQGSWDRVILRDDDSGTLDNSDSGIVFVAPEDDIYYFRVWDPNPTGSGGYTLAVWKAPVLTGSYPFYP